MELPAGVKDSASINSFEAVLFSGAKFADGKHSICRTDTGSMAAVWNWSDCLQLILAAIVSRYIPRARTIFQNVFGDAYFCIFLLLNDVRYKFALRPRFRVSKFLKDRSGYKADSSTSNGEAS
jgi:hypothetical protein